MKISACVIVKNEAKNIQQWLTSMKGFADEIIVVDTGSVDETKQLAQQAGARVIDYPWQDDFAAAKNFAIDHAKGEWIVFLDADEYFAPKTVEKLRGFLMRIDRYRDIAAVLCRLINIDADNNNRFITSFMQLRIFRNLSQLRYVGAIHETLVIPTGKKIEMAKDLVVYHTGYSASIVKKKLRRNLAMLQKKFKGTNGSKTAQEERYLMDIWYGLQEPAKAIDAAKRILAHNDVNDDLRGRAYETWASTCIEYHYPEKETLDCLEKAIAACPERADFRLMKGLYLFRLQDYLQAERELQSGLQLRRQVKKQSTDFADIADNAERLIPTVEWHLAEICLFRHQLDEACDHYWTGLSLFPHNEGLFRSFFRFLRMNNIGDTDLIAQLNQIYDKKNDAAFLVKALLGEKNAGRVVLYYAAQGGVKLAKKVEYQLNGNWAAAAETDAKALDRDAGILILAGKNGSKTAPVMLNQLYASNYPKWKSQAFQKRLQRMQEELKAEVQDELS